MCRTILRHHTVCKHTDVQFVHCQPQDVDFRMEAIFNTTANNRLLPMESRDHSEFETEAHCLNLKCPYCRKEEEELLEARKRDQNNVTLHRYTTIHPVGEDTDLPEGVTAWRNFADSNRQRAFASLSQRLVAQADENQQFRAWTILGHVLVFEARNATPVLDHGLMRVNIGREIRQRGPQGSYMLRFASFMTPVTSLGQRAMLEIFVPIFPLNFAVSGDYQHNCFLVAAALDDYDCNIFKDTSCYPLSNMLYEWVLNLSSPLWTALDALLHDIARQRVLEDGIDHRLRLVSSENRTLREAGSIVWAVACLLICVDAHREVQSRLETASNADLQIVRAIMDKTRCGVLEAALCVERGQYSLGRLLHHFVHPETLSTGQPPRLYHPVSSWEIQARRTASMSDSLTPTAAFNYTVPERTLRRIVDARNMQIRAQDAQSNNENVFSVEAPEGISETNVQPGSSTALVQSSPRSHDQVDKAVWTSQPKNRIGRTCNTLVKFEACGHYNAIRTEKLTYKDDATIFSRCGCAGFAPELNLSQRATSRAKCLLCRKREILPEHAFRLEVAMKFAEFVFGRYVSMKSRQRDIDLWPFEITGCTTA